MQRRLSLVPLLGAALLLASCEVREHRSMTIRREWPASAIRRLEVHEVAGTVSVEAGAPDRITLVAHVRGLDRDDRSNAFTAEIAGDTLRLGRHERRGRLHLPFFFGDRRRIDYELHVPPQIAVDLNTVNGRIVTRGIEGETACVTVNGHIDAEVAGTSELRANAVNGRVEARFVRSFAGARLKTVNGRVRATLPQTASFTVDLSQVNGDFEAAFPLSIHSHPGSRRVSGEVNGGQYELRIVTVNGDVEVLNGPKAEPPQPPTAPQPPVPPSVPAAPPAPPSAPVT